MAFRSRSPILEESGSEATALSGSEAKGYITKQAFIQVWLAPLTNASVSSSASCAPHPPPFLDKGNARSLHWHLEDNVAAAKEVTNEPSREQFRTSNMETSLKKKRQKETYLVQN